MSSLTPLTIRINRNGRGRGGGGEGEGRVEWGFHNEALEKREKGNRKVDRTLDLPHTGLCGEGGRQLGCARGVDDVLQHKDLMGRANHGL